MEQISQWLWKQEYWLPPGITWEDMEKKEGCLCPLPRDLLISLPVTVGFIMLPLGVKDQVRLKVTPVPHLEAFYTKHSKQPTQNDIAALMKQSDWTHRQVEVWFRHRRNQDRPSSSKFCEACWRFMFYLIAFTAGLASLINVLCLCSLLLPVQDGHYWYYMLELGFYWSLLLCVSVDMKRKDFKEQIVHHFATIFLLGFSYCTNYIRVGTLVMLVHDSSDFLLESAKMFNYAGWKKTCDLLFVIFAAIFLLSRLVVIIYTTLVLSMDIFEPFMGYYFFNSLLMVLQLLHIYWDYLILRMIYKFLFLGKQDKDERSDVESEPDEEVEKEERQSSWRKRKVVMDSRLAILNF
ncbi:putative ceramide synthase 2-like [Triplophysa rosa]|uniref:Ceramide synthase 2-like n=1 Tax=Triplophysa rosa TaxID=992332 RepID=A0A9W7WWF9_TRIRA|nr:putative ceramide synthase 2-like [Triplophysa rosa]